MTEKHVGIVILNYVNWQDTVECLQSVLDDNYPSRSVIMVDNCSWNESVERVQEWLKARDCPSPFRTEADPVVLADRGSILLIQSRSNRGFAAGNNIGIRAALAVGSDYVLILNGDTIVCKGCLQALVEYMESHPACGLASPKVVFPNGEIDRTCARRRPRWPEYFFRLGLGRRLLPGNRWIRSHIYAGEYNFSAPRCVDMVSGACMFFRREALDAVGLLDENTFLYLEEFILHEKLRKTSYETAIVPAGEIVHKGGGSTMQIANNFLTGVMHRSLWYYLRKSRRFNVIAASLLFASVVVADTLAVWGGAARHAIQSKRRARSNVRRARE